MRDTVFGKDHRECTKLKEYRYVKFVNWNWIEICEIRTEKYQKWNVENGEKQNIWSKGCIWNNWGRIVRLDVNRVNLCEMNRVGMYNGWGSC